MPKDISSNNTYKKTSLFKRMESKAIEANMRITNQWRKIKSRFLCLHGFRTRADILEYELLRKWDPVVLDKLDLVFVNAAFPCRGKSDVEGIFDPPFYEWYHTNKEMTEPHEKVNECITYIEECMIKYGPFDGLLGFSQGGMMAAVLALLQAKGLALTKIPKIKCVIIIGGGKIKDKSGAEKAYGSPITCPSLHFIGKEDFMRESGTQLLQYFVDPVAIYHPKGHTIPRFDEKSLGAMLSFIEKIERDINRTEKFSLGHKSML
ncbi:unnamed protein product [Cuscuta epithymum]|uniref:Serine hydrolase domain-containing protein n=1 Tax=Cuscuta epithymum TaxID=186058 RepID=A0AAV0DPE6_9ASTE|nr:unnamed protein product [Cuscuta epithymum]